MRTCLVVCFLAVSSDFVIAQKFKGSLLKDPVCKDNEVFKLCETCYRSCDRPKPVCGDKCQRGCFCKEGLVRDRDGRCVKLEECTGKNSTELRNVSCGPHEIYQQCQRCEKTCNNLSPLCIGPCRVGCFCDDDYVKSPSGECVKMKNCPKAKMTLIGVHEPSVEDCSSDEEYLSCGWCEPSCSEPSPQCPLGACTSGCLCRPPLLRHYSGHCVHEKDCLPRHCSDPREEYVCRYGCEPRCENQTCAVRQKRCTMGCHCRLGFRRHASGRCVTPGQCSDYTPIENTEVLITATTDRPIIFEEIITNDSSVEL